MTSLWNGSPKFLKDLFNNIRIGTKTELIFPVLWRGWMEMASVELKTAPASGNGPRISRWKADNWSLRPRRLYGRLCWIFYRPPSICRLEGYLRTLLRGIFKGTVLFFMVFNHVDRSDFMYTYLYLATLKGKL